MKNLLLIFIVSLSMTQIPIETREYRFYKEQNINEVNLLDLIQESKGLFKVELVAINQSKYEARKKVLVVTCELALKLSSDYSKDPVDFKICKDKVISNDYLMINKQNPNIEFKHSYKYLEGEFIFRISGEYKDTKTSSNKTNNGILREWYDNGELYLEFTMKNGIKNGVCKKWYDNGQLQIIYNYNKGKLNGNQRKWFPSGNLRAEWNYLNDELHGVSSEWNDDGSIKSKKQYKHGTLIKNL